MSVAGRLGALIGALLLSGGAVAQPKGFTLECEIASQGADGGFGSVLFIAFEEGWKNPAALNWAIEEVHKAPIPVKLVSNEGKRARISWKLEGLKYESGRSIGPVTYAASIDKASLALRMTLSIQSGDGRYFAEGSCKKII